MKFELRRIILFTRNVEAMSRKVISAPHHDMCDGKDPDGNAFQISSRK